MSFKNLKKNRKDFDSIREKLAPAQSNENDNYYPEKDSSGTGYARIRFLPAKDEVSHIVTYSRFNAKNEKGNKTYSAKNRRSIDKDDPFSEYLNVLWNTGTDEAKEIYRKHKRRVLNVCYIQVIDDKVNPEKNGQIKKYYMPLTIKKKIQEAIDPSDENNKYEDSAAIAFNAFDMFGGDESGGRDFIIKIKIEGGYPNYDDSTFVDKSTPWLEDEAEMEKLWSEHVKEDITDILKEDSFATYEKGVEMILETFGSEKSLSGDIVRDLFSDQVKDRVKEESSNVSKDIDEEETSKTESKEVETKVSSTKKDDDDEFQLDF